MRKRSFAVIFVLALVGVVLLAGPVNRVDYDLVVDEQELEVGDIGEFTINFDISKGGYIGKDDSVSLLVRGEEGGVVDSCDFYLKSPEEGGCANFEFEFSSSVVNGAWKSSEKIVLNEDSLKVIYHSKIDLLGFVLGYGSSYTKCGDGAKQHGEECDWSTPSADDDCKEKYGKESFCREDCTCSNLPPEPKPGKVCGDGKVNQEWEECDEGKMCSDGKLCADNSDCIGMVFGDKECKTRDTETCDRFCQEKRCGNWEIEGDEECDDGMQCSNGKDCEESFDCAGIGDLECKTRDGDGCSAGCMNERDGGFCGDGKVNLLWEECDDGMQCSNGVDCEAILDCWALGVGDLSCEPRHGDGCSADCKLEMFPVNIDPPIYAPCIEYLEGELCFSPLMEFLIDKEDEVNYINVILLVLNIILAFMMIFGLNQKGKKWLIFPLIVLVAIFTFSALAAGGLYSGFGFNWILLILDLILFGLVLLLFYDKNKKAINKWLRYPVKKFYQ